MSNAQPTRRGVSVLIGLLLLAAPVAADALSFWDDLPNNVLKKRLLDAMTPEELIAQTLMVGWEGQPPSPQIMEWLRSTNLGGVKVFGWNTDDLIALARSIGTMQGTALEHRLEIPLLTATDQEGGWVRHVKGSGELTTMVTPGNMAIGASGLPYDAYKSGYYIGMELRSLGINMNFAPTVDVYVNPEAHVIGPRAFSDDPIQAGMLGVAFYHGLEETRVIATAKHFPGHGNAADDSHGVLPVIDDSYDELAARDLVPFRFLINEGVPAVLSGHLNFPNISDDRRPASLSSYFTRQLLRRDLGFQRLIITDDLYMGGAWEYGADHDWGIEEIVTESLRVGNDMVMLSKTPERNGTLLERLLEEYRADAGFRARVRAAASQVLDLKLAYLKPDDRVPLKPEPDRVAGYLSTGAGAGFFRDQAGRSVTVLRDRSVPYTPEPNERILLAGKDRDFLRVGAELLPAAEQVRITSTRFNRSDARDRARLRELAADYDTVIFCLSDPNTAEVLSVLNDSDARVIVFSILTPIYLRELPWVRSAIAVYGWGDDSFRAGFSVLLGRADAHGTSPVSVGREPR